MKMKFKQSCSFICIFAAIFGSAFGSSFAASSENPPDDFSISYHIKSGSVPPPYYSEYVITIAPGGKAEISLTPDRPADAVPKWTEGFDLDAAKLKELYGILISEQAFSLNWEEPTPPKLGAPSKVVRITAGSRQVEIPYQVVKAQYPAKKRITAAIKALIPDPVWETLKEKHLEYAKEHYPGGAK